MNTVVDEGLLRFTFDSNWRVCNWDDDPAYHAGLRRLSGTRGVEFIGIHLSDAWLIEAKDYRGHRSRGRDARRSGELVHNVTEKVRDSIAGVIWACFRRDVHWVEFPRVVQALINRAQKLPIVVWIEEDKPIAPTAARALAKNIERELRPWLNAHVHVLDLDLASRHNPVPGMMVSKVVR